MLLAVEAVISILRGSLPCPVLSGLGCVSVKDASLILRSKMPVQVTSSEQRVVSMS